MSSKPDLKLDWCSGKAATYACERWHYSKCIPKFKTVKIGVWENGAFIGCVIFTNPMPPVVKRFRCQSRQITELARVALARHQTPVSRIIAIATKMIVKTNPGLIVLVSYADTGQGHHGGIYQASGFSYFGKNDGGREYLFKGRWVHPRTIVGAIANGSIGKDDAWSLPSRSTGGKHCYAKLIGNSKQYRIPLQSQPFPKRARSIDSDAPGVQSGEGGATPTRALSG